jgi:hypothetical protein
MLNFKTSWAINLPNEYSMRFAGTKAGLALPQMELYSTMGRYQAESNPATFRRASTRARTSWAITTSWRTPRATALWRGALRPAGADAQRRRRDRRVLPRLRGAPRSARDRNHRLRIGENARWRAFSRFLSGSGIVAICMTFFIQKDVDIARVIRYN